MSETIKL